MGEREKSESTFITLPCRLFLPGDQEVRTPRPLLPRDPVLEPPPRPSLGVEVSSTPWAETRSRPPGPSFRSPEPQALSPQTRVGSPRSPDTVGSGLKVSPAPSGPGFARARRGDSRAVGGATRTGGARPHLNTRG